MIGYNRTHKIPRGKSDIFNRTYYRVMGEHVLSHIILRRSDARKFRRGHRAIDPTCTIYKFETHNGYIIEHGKVY